ncbi:class I SAM-dependent methyltransferase [Chitinophaga vietnamensis]|uniref:class I SAM-dependent methyltransferase n=1 Tax=Chitinophaga vietnamensis TaxID=2593957 RepID=UPI0011777BE4|nr:class I SAM-dependent methyltransferase [Chitinophaga vietnamensis]
MGSQAVQGPLWDRHAKDWASIQEATAMPGYRYVLDKLHLQNTDRLLDIGCGSGLFCHLAAGAGALVSGIDASEALIDAAMHRDNTIDFFVADMEELPFDDHTFDIITGFNSFQFAADPHHALAITHRILKNDGRIVVMIWGNYSDCEASAYFQALARLLPPPSPGTPGPFALSEDRSLENLLESVGFIITEQEDIPIVWHYENTDIALRGLLSAGPATRAADHAGAEAARHAIAAAIKPFTQANGHVVMHNKFRVVFARRLSGSGFND